ncbi:MaoC family dehydratase [Roseibium sp.]|uniref:MaoC family dehydratase n=1 Tax=Roseibium sp. TaxID=1936156 RepID=UPI003A981D5E
MTKRYYFEDLVPGLTFELGSYTVSREEIIEFASEFDPQPFHLDEKAGKASILGGLASSGWHTASITMRLLALGLLNQSSCQGAPGIEKLQWRKPVFAGDTLSARMEVIAARPLRSRPNLGVVTMRLETRNQHGVPVMTYDNPALFARREVGG